MRDPRGRYTLASAKQILEVARLVINQKMQRGTEFNSPFAVKEYLRASLAYGSTHKGGRCHVQPFPTDVPSQRSGAWPFSLQKMLEQPNP
ncbi:hypothetical protein [Prodigiosinella confusarubida]|uniref:hypothetical protein n=1 Tax=Serratia sp. (strain ATCC 39006) TaxID=104623 RepID=UPI003CE5071F